MTFQATSLQRNLQSLNLPVHRPFVAPILCKDLIELGLTKAAKHTWKIMNGDAFVFTEHYDPDGYYSAAQSLLDQNYCNIVLPAYLATDLEPLVGDFTHLLMNGTHEIFPQTYRLIGRVTAPRYADAIAMMLISAIKKHQVSVAKLNQTLSQ